MAVKKKTATTTKITEKQFQAFIKRKFAESLTAVPLPSDFLDRDDKIKLAQIWSNSIKRGPPAPETKPAKEWTGWRQPKVAMKWFPSINSKRGWTTFANRLRNEGNLKNHPTTGDKLVSIHHSVFAMLGLTLPVNVEVIAL